MKTGLFWQALHLGPARRGDRASLVAERIIDFLEIQHIRKVPVGQPPYGLQKRVELGCALAAQPELLLLDEPMAGMNIEEKQDMCRFVLDVNDEFGTTICLIEHDMGVVMGHFRPRRRARLRQEDRRRRAGRDCEQPGGHRRPSGSEPLSLATFLPSFAGRRTSSESPMLGPFLETLIGGLLTGVLYSLVALGFVLIFKASGVFNFAQGAMVLFAAPDPARPTGETDREVDLAHFSRRRRDLGHAVALIGWYAWREYLARGGGRANGGGSRFWSRSVRSRAEVPVIFTARARLAMWLAIAAGCDHRDCSPMRSSGPCWRHLVNQEGIILFMATLGTPISSTALARRCGQRHLQDRPRLAQDPIFLLEGVFEGGLLVDPGDLVVASLPPRLSSFRHLLPEDASWPGAVGRRRRPCRGAVCRHPAQHHLADRVDSPGLVALVAGMMGRQARCTVLDLAGGAQGAAGADPRRLHPVPGAIVGGLTSAQVRSFPRCSWRRSWSRRSTWPAAASKNWFAYMLALVFLLFRPQGLFGERLIERVQRGPSADDALPRGRPIQVRLRCRPADFSDLQDRIFVLAMIVLAFLAVPMIATPLPLHRSSDPVPDPVAGGDRAEHPGGLLRPGLCLAPAASWRSAPTLPTISGPRAGTQQSRRRFLVRRADGGGRRHPVRHSSLRIKGFISPSPRSPSQFFLDWLFARVKWLTNYTPRLGRSRPARGLRLARRYADGTLPSPDPDHRRGGHAGRQESRGHIGRSWMATATWISPPRSSASSRSAPSSRPRRRLVFHRHRRAMWAFLRLGAWEPLAFDINRSFQILFMVIIGGLGSPARQLPGRCVHRPGAAHAQPATGLARRPHVDRAAQPSQFMVFGR